MAKIKEINYAEQENKCRMIRQLIKTLGFDDMFDKKKIPQDKFMKNAAKAMKTCDLFTQAIGCTLFKDNKASSFFSDCEEGPSFKKFQGEMNSAVLHGFQLSLGTGREPKRINGKKVNGDYVCLNTLNNIEEFVKLKSECDPNLTSHDHISDVEVVKWKDLIQTKSIPEYLFN